jgi:hypothetical protein
MRLGAVLTIARNQSDEMAVVSQDANVGRHGALRRS